MVSLKALFAASSVAAIAAASIADERYEAANLQPRQGSRFAFQAWQNNYTNVNYTNGAGGEYSVKWDNSPAGDFVIGKGYYSVGSGIKFNYSGSFSADSDANAYLALYGWTTNPLVEFYVIESMGSHNPSDNASATLYGYVESDGGLYEIWEKIRTNAPSIQGTSTYPQYWSVRTKMRCGGTVNLANHFQAWKDAGLKMGTGSSVVLAIEGQWGGGSADLTVGTLPKTPVLETPTPTRRTAPPHYTTHITGRTTTWDFDTTITTSGTTLATTTTTTTPHTTSTSTSQRRPPVDIAEPTA